MLCTQEGGEEMWDKLSMRDRAKLIELGVRNGITDLNTIRDTYNQANKYPDGGGIILPIPSTSNILASDKSVQSSYNSKEFLYPEVNNREEFMQLNSDRAYYNGNKDPEYLSNRSPEYNFYINDYANRLRQRHPEQAEYVKDVLSSTAFYDTPVMGAAAEYHPNGFINIPKRYREGESTTLAHELSHAMDFRLNLSNKKTLESNYDLSKDYNKKGTDAYDLHRAYNQGNFPGDEERRATNTELRYKLYQSSGGKTGESLDSYMNNLDINSLRNAADSIKSGYFSGKDINESNIEAIKNALKNVAMNTSTPYTNYAAKGGKIKTYVRENNNPVAFDREGNLVDQVTGDKGTMVIPEVVVSARDPKNYRSSFDRYAVPDLINWATENTVGKIFSPIIENIPYAANVAQALTPSSWVGTLKTGKAPWDLTNTGFGETKDDEVKNMLFDSLVGYKVAKITNRANRIRHGLKPYNLRRNFYVNRQPASYKETVDVEGNKVGKSLLRTAKDMAKTIISGEEPYIDLADWNTVDKFKWAKELGVDPEKARKARIDSYSIYNKQPQRYGTYTTHPEDPNSLTDELGIRELNRVPDIVTKHLEEGRGVTYDYINTTGGNIGYTLTDLGEGLNGNKYLLFDSNDIWNTQPFKSFLDDNIPKITTPYNNKVLKFNNKINRLANRVKIDKKAVNEAYKNAGPLGAEFIDPRDFTYSGIREKIGNQIAKIQLPLLDPNSIKNKPLIKKIADIEIGDIFPGGLNNKENYRYSIPMTRIERISFNDIGEPIIYPEYYTGFIGDNLPVEAVDFMKKHPHYEYRPFEQRGKTIKKLEKEKNQRINNYLFPENPYPNYIIPYYLGNQGVNSEARKTRKLRE